MTSPGGVIWNWRTHVEDGPGPPFGRPWHAFELGRFGFAIARLTSRARAKRQRNAPATVATSAGERRPGELARTATILVDGRPLRAVDGQSLAGVLTAAGLRSWRANPVTAEPRGPYCGMGVCFECEVTVDGVAGTLACQTHVTSGMTVATEPVGRTHDGDC